MKTITLMLLVLILTFSVTSCHTDKEVTPLAKDIDQNTDDSNSSSQLVTYGVAGFITNITENNDLGTILVEGELGKNGADYDKGSVRITVDTVIHFNNEGSFEDFKLGQYVQVFFEGPVAESYPVQGTARQINIVDTPIFIDDPTENE